MSDLRNTYVRRAIAAAILLTATVCAGFISTFSAVAAADAPAAPLATAVARAPQPLPAEPLLSKEAPGGQKEAGKGEMDPSPNVWGIETMSDEEIQLLIDLCEDNEEFLSMALAVMWKESRFGAKWVSPDGRDWGFFQLRDSNHGWLQEATGADPTTREGNIICGVHFLKVCLDYGGGSIKKALTIYRWGHDNGRYNYANDVMEKMNDFRQPQLSV